MGHVEVGAILIGICAVAFAMALPIAWLLGLALDLTIWTYRLGVRVCRQLRTWPAIIATTPSPIRSSAVPNASDRATEHVSVS